MLSPRLQMLTEYLKGSLGANTETVGKSYMLVNLRIKVKSGRERRIIFHENQYTNIYDTACIDFTPNVHDVRGHQRAATTWRGVHCAFTGACWCR